MNLRKLIEVSAATVVMFAIVSCSGNGGGNGKTVDETGKVVRPVREKSSTAKITEPMADGGYHVAFDGSKIDVNGNVEVEFFNYDLYRSGAIDSLSEGDRIIITNKEITVESVSHATDDIDRKTVTINSDSKDGKAYTLCLEDDGYYRTVTADNSPLYYSIGKKKMEIAPFAAFIDESDPLNVVDTSGRLAILKSANPKFKPVNTTAGIKNNVITFINRIQ